jgi:hypothetical protein
MAHVARAARKGKALSKTLEEENADIVSSWSWIANDNVAVVGYLRWVTGERRGWSECDGSMETICLVELCAARDTVCNRVLFPAKRC